MKIIYLQPLSTFRTHLRSDTLWGMICWAIRNVYGNAVLENLLETYNSGNPEFIISSTFPYSEIKGIKKYFLPKPFLKEEEINQSNLSRAEKIKIAKQRKKLKKVKYLELNEYLEFINGNKKLHDIVKKIANNEELKSPQLISESVTHNTINRLTGGTLKIGNKSGQLFHIDELFFKYNQINDITENYGLFFLARGNTEKLEGALRFLSHIGIGGDRNIGKGKFLINIDDFTLLKEPADYNAMTNLSLYYPREDELIEYKKNDYFTYQLEERQGYVSFLKYDKFNKPTTMMFQEGSVFPKLEKEYFGSNKTLYSKSDKIPHNVYQYGYGFMVKIKI